MLDTIIIKNKSIFDMDLNNLFDYLKIGINYYTNYYDNLNTYENIISTHILKIIE
jgi:hypothetical protein